MKSLLKKLLAPLALIAFLAGPVYAQDDPPADPPAATEEAADTAPDPAAPATEATDNPQPSENEAGADVEDAGEASDEEAEADASPVAGKTGLQNLSEALMEILLPSVTLLVTGLVSMLLVWIRKKTKIEVSDKSIYAWSVLAGKGASRAGEWGRNKVSDLTEGKTVPGPEILEVGTNWAIEAGRAAGLPAMGRKVIEGWIEGHLHTERMDPSHPRPA